MSAIADAIVTYAILRKFTTPIKDTPAYKMGLVDENGVPTQKAQYNHTEQAGDAYTLLDRLVFKLKRLWKSMPAFSKLIGSYAAALAFIKEDTDTDVNEFAIFEHLDSSRADYWGGVLSGDTVLGIEEHVIVRIAEDRALLAKLVEAYANGTQDLVAEEMAAAIGNSVSSGQVQGLATEPVITKNAQKKWVAKNQGRKIEEILP